MPVIYSILGRSIAPFALFKVRVGARHTPPRASEFSAGVPDPPLETLPSIVTMDEFQTPVGGGEDFFAGAFPVRVSALVAFPSRVDARCQHSEWRRESRVGSRVFPPRARLAFLPRESGAPAFRANCAPAIPNPPLRVVLAREQPPSPRDLEKAHRSAHVPDPFPPSSLFPQPRARLPLRR